MSMVIENFSIHLPRSDNLAATPSPFMQTADLSYCSLKHQLLFEIFIEPSRALWNIRLSPPYSTEQAQNLASNIHVIRTLLGNLVV